MQKVLQRTAMTKRQAKRKLKLLEKKVLKHEKRQYKREFSEYQKAQRANIRQARITRREDWELGPLAPRRDAGEQADTYGAMSLNAVMPPAKPASMKPKDYNIAIGDRVVITKGLDQGKIGVVREIKKEAEYAFVEGLRLTDLAIPEWQRTADGDPRPYRTLEAPVPFNECKLVFAMEDPHTGQKRDVVVEEIGIRRLNKEEKERYIPGTDITIPWPPKHKPRTAKNDDDTTVDSAQERTWVPELLTSPLPEGVIDELRNPYSRFRTRHDDEYIARKMAEDDQAAYLSDPTRNHMRTPLQELQHLKQKEKEIQDSQILSTEMLAKLGEAIASARKAKAAARA